MFMQNIELHIENLVLDGFAAVDRHRISAALQSELVRLLGTRGVPPGLAGRGDVGRLDAGSISVAPELRANRLGAQLAEAIYRGLQR